MTFTTNSNDIKPMFSLISFVVMVELCLFTARAFQGICSRQQALFNGTPDRIVDFISSWVQQLPTFRGGEGRFFSGLYVLVAFAALFAFISLFVFFMPSFPFLRGLLPPPFICFAFFGLRKVLTVFSCTWFTRSSVAIFFIFVSIKIIKRFNFLTVAASFCYSWLRHGFFLCSKTVFRAAQTQYLFGSLNCTIPWRICQ